VDNDFSFEPHLALFMKLQEAYPDYKRQLLYIWKWYWQIIFSNKKDAL